MFRRRKHVNNWQRYVNVIIVSSLEFDFFKEKGEGERMKEKGRKKGKESLRPRRAG
jgi:hypothetical protein